ncbi:HlyD family secretion protein [Teredinibacter sp. KSP-S5-2]|uniref:HlyD family secretion protein n=1 Tax=Teredinibacter sp. KSP-S5-2 TaxID=3034506 RepID=UPI002934615D|nr:HlyD family efflux transporter periplasmic adaptor subunit [Teredinibacter sp. KSP-S5-2]WNO11606.1 HlyD family efflux transporter periplasmic adaptor subunit [Teredinibacter sp. KSP-S5-2]
MKNNFFRKEAVDNFYSEKNSNLIEVESFSSKITLIVLGIISSIFLLIIIFIPYSNKVKVSGILVPDKGISRLYSKSSGFISEIHINKDDLVEAGQSILSIRISGSTSESENEYKDKLKNLESQRSIIYEQIKVNNLNTEKKSERVKQAIEESLRKVDVLKTVLELNKKSYALAKDQLKAATVSRDHLAPYRIAEIDSNKSIYETKSELISVEIHITNLLREKEQLEAENKLSNQKYNLRLSEIEQSIITLKSHYQYEITSPIKGKIIGLQGNVGDRINELTTLATIIPEKSSLIAKLFVPANGMGNIGIGDRVKVAYSAFPKNTYGMFDGTISALGDTVLKENEVHTLLSLPKEHYFVFHCDIDRQSIKIEDKLYNLKPGMELTATIVTDRRNIFFRTFKPIIELLKNM